MKSNFPQIGLNKGIKFLFLFLALCLGLFLPLRPAQAIFGFADIGLFDLFMVQLDALDFGEGTVLWLIFFLALLLIVSQVFLFFSAQLFQWAIDFPINLGITSENPLVTSGWQFTSGLVNTFLILIFVIIALAYILRIETFGAKKALPRLIIVAILINFSLVFIAIGVDTTQIILKSIVSALGSNLPRIAIDPLANSLGNLLWGYFIVTISAYLTSAVVPGLSVVSLVALIAAFIAEAGLGTISLTILLIILGFGMGSIFFLYFIFFMIRVGMIWMLAILSPLAFAAAILPNTQKYWKQWLKLLLDWLFFGIIVLLLAGLGLKLFAENKVVPNTGPISVGPWRAFPAFSYNYIFLLIYLGIMIYYSKKKFAPELADVLISQGTGLAKRAAPMARVARRGLTGWVSKQKRLQDWAKRQAEAPTPELKGLIGRAAAPITRPIWALRRGFGRALGPRIIEEEKRRVSTIESETDKIKEPSLVASKTLDDIAAQRLTEAVGRLSKAIEKGGPFKKSIVEKITLEQAVDLAKRAHDVGAVPEAERIARGFIHKFDPAEREDKLNKEMGFKSYADVMGTEEQKDWDAKGYKTITEKLIGDARRDEVKDFSTGFWENPAIRWAAHKFWGGPQLRRAAEEFGRAFTDDYMKFTKDYMERLRGLPDHVAERRFKSFVHTNPRRALYLGTNAAQEFGYESLWDLAPDVIRRRYRNLKQIIAERP